MTDARPLIFDRTLLAARRVRHAETAGEHDFLLRHAAEDLADRLLLIKRSFPAALSLGPSHDILTRALRALDGNQVVVNADIASALLPDAPGTVVADEEALPFAAASLDLVASLLSLQLVNDLPGTLIQIRRALKPDGLFLASLLGGRTLHELREAFVVAETEIEGGASPRVAPFADVRDLGALLQRAGFALPVADSDTLEVGYASPLALMRDLRGMGWTNMLHDRRRSFLKRATLARALEVYAERHSRPDGRIRATFEFITLTAWAPHESQQQPLRPGSARTRLADALGVEEKPVGDEGGGGKGE